MRRTVIDIALLSLILITSHIVASEPSTENEDDYIDLFGSTTPRPEVSDTTTPPPFWTSENEYDQVDMVLKREIFALYKIVYPAVLLVAMGITVLGFLVPIMVLLSIMQSHATRVVEEMERENNEEDKEEPMQPLESTEEWQRMLRDDD